MTPKDNKLSKLVQELCTQDTLDVENYEKDSINNCKNSIDG